MACGGGKTLAAWKWAEEQTKHDNLGKVIFLYPTRGTATEGFRDYVGWPPEANAALVTGTAKYELEAMTDSPSALETVLKTEILTYHSRFRLRDRQRVHTSTVEAFSFSQGGVPRQAIAVTTQVCEMSLDLDADVLITELAPVSSLVQRFGRANRHLKQAFARLHPYPPPGDLPYQRKDLETAQAFLGSLETDLVSQLQLATALETYARPERDAEGSSLFITSGYYAVPGSFRDIDGFAVPCLLDTDFEVVESLITNRKPYDGFIVNVPQKWAKAWLEGGNIRPKWLPKYLNVVSGSPERYQPNRGFINKAPEEVELG